jgi:hypothetical protein
MGIQKYACSVTLDKLGDIFMKNIVKYYRQVEFVKRLINLICISRALVPYIHNKSCTYIYIFRRLAF